MGISISVDSHDEEEREIDSLISEAKWDMYGGEWIEAIAKLKSAKKIAIRIHDKARIDIILDLINKASNQQRVELT